MEGRSAAPGTNRTAIVAIIVTVVALGAFVLVGIGVLLGWIPRGEASDRTPATANTGKASRGLEKFAGSEPLMPKYSQPHAPPPAPLQDFAATRQAPPPPVPAPQPATPPPSPSRGPFASGDSFGPAPPSFGRAEPRAAPESRAAPEPAAQRRGVCEECGRIIGIANWRSGWEVRVRFDDGSTEVFPFRRRPPFDLGERVRLDRGELVRD